MRPNNRPVRTFLPVNAAVGYGLAFRGRNASPPLLRPTLSLDILVFGLLLAHLHFGHILEIRNHILHDAA